MRIRASFLSLLVVLGGVEGCATILVQSGRLGPHAQSVPYGGTISDVVVGLISLRDPCDEQSSDYDPFECAQEPDEPFYVDALKGLWPLDLPLSFVADTLLLPYVLTHHDAHPPQGQAAKP